MNRGHASVPDEHHRHTVGRLDHEREPPPGGPQAIRLVLETRGQSGNNSRPVYLPIPCELEPRGEAFRSPRLATTEGDPALSGTPCQKRLNGLHPEILSGERHPYPRRR